MGWQYWVAMALLNMYASNEKKKAYDTSKRNQGAILDQNEQKRLALEKITKAKQDELLQVVDKGNVVKDSKIESSRIADLMSEQRGPTPDAIVSKGSPQIVKNALDAANKAMTAKVDQQGDRLGVLKSLTNQFDKYAEDFGDANTTAQNVAGKLKGNEGVMNIGMREASDPYSQTGDWLQNLTDLFSMYAMSQGKGSPEVVDNTKDGTSTDWGNKTGPRNQYTYNSNV
tara:strand:- start:324 stop:1007 length:684 start_codon:yes stop_codon:yes gene_type:complete